jgi:DNA-binding response OmpR family regulator
MEPPVATEMTWQILVVDDDPSVLQLVTARLETQGYTVLTAMNGQVAYGILQNQKPHLVVLDDMMPVMAGVRFCRLVRSAENHTPILFLTAKTQRQDIVEIMSAGADDYLAKPFDGNELLARIKALLRRAYPAFDSSTK